MNGFVAANDGNISVKVSENEYYCTPTGVSKGFMTPDMIIKIDADGNKLEGKLNPSSEIKMHMRVYRERPDVNAVVHAHPPTATAYAVAGIPLDKYLLPEAILVLGDVPICKYGTPSTMEIPDSLEPYIQTHDAFLLQNHGALTVGCNLTKAFFVMEEVASTRATRSAPTWAPKTASASRTCPPALPPPAPAAPPPRLTSAMTWWPKSPARFSPS